jgi:hypothetical protein
MDKWKKHHATMLTLDSDLTFLPRKKKKKKKQQKCATFPAYGYYQIQIGEQIPQ